MDEKKIAFISCVNDEEKYGRCRSYLEKLRVPEGMTTEYVPIRGAVSMTSGYNEACRRTDAKYKIYLHQDVNIVEEDFLYRLLEVFRSDDTIGVAGVVGAQDLPPSGMWPLGQNVIGGIYDDFHEPGNLRRQVPHMEDRPMEAIAVDGLLIATQYDVPWREDVFTHWDFYDVSICFEHRRHGKKVVVLPQTDPYCEHWCGGMNVTHYNDERKKFLATYSADPWRVTERILSVVIPARDALAHIEICFTTLLSELKDIPYELIIVDDASTDGTQEWLVDKGIRSIRHDKPQGLAACVSEGARLLPAACTLVLSPDTFLTKATFVRLLAALPDERAGVVGAISNAFPRADLPNPSYESYDDFLSFAADWAASPHAPHPPAPMLCLDYTAMLFNAQAISALSSNGGNLFDPLYVDSLSHALYDACLRIHQAGGSVRAAKDAYVHQNSNAPADSAEAERHFRAVWAFDPSYSANARQDLLALVDFSKSPKRVLEVGCAAGADFLALRDRIPDGDFAGIEINEGAAKIAGLFADVAAADIETMEKPDWENRFDLVILGDVLEHLRDPWRALRNIARMMCPGGELIISVPNVAHVSVFYEMLQGKWNYVDAGILDRTHLRFFTRRTAIELLTQAGLTLKRDSSNRIRLPQEMDDLAVNLKPLLAAQVDPDDLHAYQWLLVGEKPRT